MRSLRLGLSAPLAPRSRIRALRCSSRRSLPLKVATPPCWAAAAARRCGGCAGRCLRMGSCAFVADDLSAAPCVNLAPVPVAASGGRERRGRYTGLAPGFRPRTVALLLVGYGVCAPFGALGVRLRSPLAACRLLPAVPLAGFVPPGRRSSPGSRGDRVCAAAGRGSYARGPQKTGTCAAPCHCESNPGAARLPCRAPSLRRPAGVVRSARLVSGRPLVIRSPTTPLRRSGLADRALRVRLRYLRRVSVGRGALLVLNRWLLPAPCCSRRYRRLSCRQAV